MTATARKGATLALGLAVALALASVELSVGRSLSFVHDEPVHVGAGLSYLEHRRVFLNPEHPPLVKLISGAAVRALGVRESETGARLFASALETGAGNSGEQAVYGERLLLDAGPGVHFPGARDGCDAIVVAARAPLVVFPLLLALVAFLWGRARYGTGGGLIALGLVATYPDVLGHGALVTTDVPVAALSLACGFAFERLLRRGGWANVALLAAALSGALAAKFTAVLLVPGLVVVLAVAAARGTGDPAPSSLTHPGGVGSWRSRLAGAALLTLLVAALASLALSACYLGEEPFSAYVRGLRSVGGNHSRTYAAFCLGRYAVGGFWWYFPVVFLLKAPLGTLALLLLAVVAAAAGRGARASLAEESALHLFPVAVLVAATLGTAQIGVRYLLPALPFLFVSAGRLAPWARRSRGRWIPIALALASNLVVNVRDHPFHASSTNLLAGPPELAYRLLDDSNQDWGQGLKALGEWQRERGAPELVVVTPFQTFSKEHLDAYGVRGIPCGGEIALLFRPPRGRVLAVSSHLMARAGSAEHGLQRRALAAAGASEETAPPGFLVLGRAILPSELVGGGYLIFDLRSER